MYSLFSAIGPSPFCSGESNAVVVVAAVVVVVVVVAAAAVAFSS